MKVLSAFALAGALFTAVVVTAAPPLVNTSDLKGVALPKEKGRANIVEDRTGKAIRFDFDKDARSVFFSVRLRGTPDWDKAAGFSFRVKGDGGKAFGGLQLIFNDDYGVRYDYCFPIPQKEWTTVTVAWADLVPVIPGAKSKPLGGTGGNPPSKLTSLAFGKWWYWGDYPALTYAIENVRLEPVIEWDMANYKPEGLPLARVRDKLKAGKPVTIVTMGDSLTDPRHHANRKVVWPDLLRDRVKSKYKATMTIVNPAIGGTQLRQNLVLIPRWLDVAPEPDLVTLFFGGNDWEAGMRGEEFARSCADAVDRVRKATKGKADVLLLTTAPSVQRWETLAELGEACRRAATERQAGLADVEASFHSAGKSDPDRLFIFDKVHLSPAGHELVAETVLKAIEAGK